MDISRPCQPEKLIPLLPWPGFDPSFSRHNDRRAIISEWTWLRLGHRGWLGSQSKIPWFFPELFHFYKIPWNFILFFHWCSLFVGTLWRYAYGIVSSARWVYLSTSLQNLSRAFRRVKDRRTSAEITHLARFLMFCALLNVFIISFFTRVRDTYSTDLVSKWGVCFGVWEDSARSPQWPAINLFQDIFYILCPFLRKSPKCRANKCVWSYTSTKHAIYMLCLLRNEKYLRSFYLHNWIYILPPTMVSIISLEKIKIFSLINYIYAEQIYYSTQFIFITSITDYITGQFDNITKSTKLESIKWKNNICKAIIGTNLNIYTILFAANTMGCSRSERSAHFVIHFIMTKSRTIR